MKTCIAIISPILLAAITTIASAQSGSDTLVTNNVVGNGQRSLKFAAEGLPPGLSIDVRTGKISGTISRTALWKSGDVFKVLVSYHNGDGASGVAKIDIHPVNSSPIAVDDEFYLATGDGVAASIGALANDHDPEGDPISFISARSIHGTVVTSDGGIMFYLPNDASRDGFIDYEVGDGHGGAAKARVTVRASK